jgi:nicotinamidase-related amidase
MSDITANVLIVVDVQNCLNDNSDPIRTDSLVSEIADLVQAIPFDYYIVTRDCHPTNHQGLMVGNNPNQVIVNRKNGTRNIIHEKAAFLGSPAISNPDYEQVIPLGGPWPHHCISNSNEFKHINKCMARKNLGENDMSNMEKFVTEPSVFYKKYIAVAPILQYFYNPDMKLHLLDEPEEQFKEPSETKFQLTVTNIPGSKDARGPVLQLVKGQLCNWDAYSAFQYHADFRRGQFVNDVRGDLNNTTGLAEVLFSKELGITHFKPNVKKVNIIVCGMMGEIAVKYTVSYGLNTLISAKSQGGLKGYDRFQGYLITPAEIPKVNFIYSSYGTRFIPYPLIIAGVHGIREEIKYRIEEAGGNTNYKNSGNGISYTILLPSDDELINKIDTVGVINSSTMVSVTDAIGLTKTGGTRKLKRKSKNKSNRKNIKTGKNTHR